MEINGHDAGRVEVGRTVRLSALVTQLAGAIQVAGAIFRHGFQAREPTTGEAPGPTHRYLLEKSLAGVQQAIEDLCTAHDISEATIRMRQLQLKTQARLEPPTHHQSGTGERL